MINRTQQTTESSIVAAQNFPMSDAIRGSFPEAAVESNEAPIRLWKVQQLRAEIAAGTYRVSPTKIAEAMMSFEMRRKLTALPGDGRLV